MTWAKGTPTNGLPKRFNTGRMSVDGEDRSGRPSTGTTTEKVAVQKVILEDRRERFTFATLSDCCVERAS